MMLRGAHSIRDTESLFIGCARGVHPAALFSRFDVCGQSKPTEGCKCPIGIHCKATQPHCRAKAWLLTMGAAAWWNEPEESDGGNQGRRNVCHSRVPLLPKWGTQLPSPRIILWNKLKSSGSGAAVHPTGGNICCWICSGTCALLFFVLFFLTVCFTLPLTLNRSGARVSRCSPRLWFPPPSSCCKYSA